MSDYLLKRRAIMMGVREPDPKKAPVPIAKKSAKKIEQEKKENKSGDNKLDTWFNERRQEMSGRCLLCGGKTEKHNDETFRHSIAHLLPKRKGQFPSIATHPYNWIELCFYGNSCHTNFDNGIITWELLRDSKEWQFIADKFNVMYGSIAADEVKNIPSLLLELIK